MAPSTLIYIQIELTFQRCTQTVHLALALIDKQPPISNVKDSLFQRSTTPRHLSLSLSLLRTFFYTYSPLPSAIGSSSSSSTQALSTTCRYCTPGNSRLGPVALGRIYEHFTRLSRKTECAVSPYTRIGKCSLESNTHTHTRERGQFIRDG